MKRKRAYPFCRICSIHIYNAHGIIKSHRFYILLGWSIYIRWKRRHWDSTLSTSLQHNNYDVVSTKLWHKYDVISTSYAWLGETGETWLVLSMTVLYNVFFSSISHGVRWCTSRPPSPTCCSSSSSSGPSPYQELARGSSSTSNQILESYWPQR